MRPFPLVLALAAAALPAALAPRAAAAPFTDHFQDLVLELVERDGEIPFPAQTKVEKRQRAALARCFRLLEGDSADLAGDLKLARRMAPVLARGFPDDPEFGAMVVALDAALAGDAADIRDELEVTIALLAEGKIKIRAGTKLARADAIWTEAEAEPEAIPRVRLREKSHKQVLKGARIAARGQPGGPSTPSTMTATVAGSAWAANEQFGTGVTGLVQVSETNDGVRKVLVQGRRILPSTAPPAKPGDPPLPGDTSRIQITIQRVTSDLQEGATYVIGNADGVNASASWIENLEDGSSSQALGLSGSVTLSSLEIGFGVATVRGTFSLVMVDGEDTFDISGGAFESVDVPVQIVP
jgi:hypothetical protein